MEASLVWWEKVPVASYRERTDKRVSGSPVAIGREKRGERRSLRGGETMVMDVVDDGRRGGGR